MECLGPECAGRLLDWLREQSARLNGEAAPATTSPRQATLWNVVPYQDDAPAIRSAGELAGAFEHLDYSVFRRYQNQLTRAERSRLDNTIRNALFKIDRYAGHLEGAERERVEAQCRATRDQVQDSRDQAERLRLQARRADLKLSQLGSLTPEGFEEFVAEVFEALGFEVEIIGGTGDEGADLKVRRGGLSGVVQCKYFSKGVVGSPELQKFLGTIHHMQSHKGFFVTTRTFTLAAERFASENPIELIDGPRLIEIVREAIGPGAQAEPVPAWF